MENLLKDLLKQILRKHPDTIAVLLHGSSLSGKLENFSDIDFNIFISGKPKNPIEDSIIGWNNKKILVNLNIENYKEALESAKTEKRIEQILMNWTALGKIRVLYDPKGLIPKLKKETEIRFKGFVQKYAYLLNIKFNILIDTFFKMQRVYARKNKLKIFTSAEIIANQSARIVQFFNNLPPEKMYNSILMNYDAVLNLRKTPAHFKEDFLVCMGFRENLKIKQIYASANRLAFETIQFLTRQNLKEIKNEEFFELLEQSKKLFKKI